ncbi:MAG: hypothetical protein KIS87_00135 [Phycisphaeraceae bacterium]|nr:hypothetical protein [Phycisphaeraceae bacterium]
MLSRTGWGWRSGLGTIGAAVVASFAAAVAGDHTVDVFQENGVYLMRDRASHRIIYDQRKLLMYDTRKDASYLEPQVEVVPQSEGIDFVYTFTNDGGKQRRMADLRMGTFVLDDTISYRDVRAFCEEFSVAHGKSPPPTYTYPGTMYAPVYLLADKYGTFGISLQYPLLEYQHDVNFRVRSAPMPKTEGVLRGWILDIRISLKDGDDSGGGNINYPGFIQPGETRTYVVNVRYTPNNDNWMQTLLPYRDYFRSVYGGVHYQRENGPIKGVTTGGLSDTTDDNPYGFTPEKFRPDLYGFAQWVDMSLGHRDWPEIMIFKPSGNYHRAKEWNFPFLYMSHLLTDPKLATAYDTETGIASIPRRGVKLGLWWGRAIQVAKTWEPVTSYPLDPNDPEHVSLAFNELDLSVYAGATTIGLDTYSHRVVPTWITYDWLRRMRARHPGVKFVIEPIATDVMHTLAAMWLRGWDESSSVEKPEDVVRIKNPHYVADFLLPGHETWGTLRYAYVKARFGIDVPEEQAMKDVAYYASMGYRPVLFGHYGLLHPVVAVESWLTTVPAHLQIPRDQWVLIRDPYNPDAEPEPPPPHDDRDGKAGDSGGGGSGGGQDAPPPFGGSGKAGGGGSHHGGGSFTGGGGRVSKPEFDPDDVAEAARRARNRGGDRVERP